MSIIVEDNYLVVRDRCGEVCKKKIFDLLVDGSIDLTKSFLPLWTLYQPRSNHHFFTVDPMYPNFVIFPTVNPVNFEGKLILESGGFEDSPKGSNTSFVNFLRIDGRPTRTSAVTNEGLALQMYVNKDGEKPDYLIEWEASENVKWVLLYFLINAGNSLVLRVDRCNRLSRYCGNKGKATFSQAGYMYMKCISTSDDFSVKLRVTAVEPPRHQSLVQFKPGKLCLSLCACSQREKIHVASNINILGNKYETIPAPQWETVFNLVDETISEITTHPIPLAPIIRPLREVDYNISLLASTSRMTGDGGTRDVSFFRSFLRTVEPILVVTRDGVSKEFVVPQAIQDNSTALQGVFYDGVSPGDVITVIPAALTFTVTFTIQGGTLNNYHTQYQFQNRIDGIFNSMIFYNSEEDRAANRNPQTILDISQNTSNTVTRTVYFKSLPDVSLYATLFTNFIEVEATSSMTINYDIRS